MQISKKVMLRPCCCFADGALPPLIWSLLCECADDVSFPSTRTSWEGSPLSTLLIEKYNFYFPSSIGFWKHPHRIPSFDITHGKAQVLFPVQYRFFENIPTESALSTLLIEKHNFYFPSSICFWKHPHRIPSFDITHGKAQVLFPDVQYRFLKSGQLIDCQTQVLFFCFQSSVRSSKYSAFCQQWLTIK